MRYRILGTYRGVTELLDETDDWSNAMYLKGEYRLAFGAGWVIEIEETKC